MGLRQMDSDEFNELMDSIPSGLFAIELAKLNVDISRFFIDVEDCFTGVGSVDGGQLFYEFCDVEGEFGIRKVTGSVKTGFVTEESDYDSNDADRIRNSAFW